MKYNLANDNEVKEAQQFLVTSTMRNKVVDIKVIRDKRTLSQNAYLHLILSAFAAEFGYSLEEAKTLYKRINSNTYVYEVNNQKFLKSSADLNTEEMSTSIEKFKQYSSENGLDLPDAYNEDQMRYYENEIEKNRRFL